MIFNINGKTYTSKKLGYGFLVWAEQKGISLENMSEFSTLAIFFAYFSGMSVNAASEEIEAHIVASDEDNLLDSVKGLSEAIAEEQNNSAFFQKLFKKSKGNNPENPQSEANPTEAEKTE